MNKWFGLFMFLFLSRAPNSTYKHLREETQERGWLTFVCKGVIVCQSGPVQPSLSVNQSAGSLAVTETFGPEVLGITRCGVKEINMNKLRPNITD